METKARCYFQDIGHGHCPSHYLNSLYKQFLNIDKEFLSFFFWHERWMVNIVWPSAELNKSLQVLSGIGNFFLETVRNIPPSGNLSSKNLANRKLASFSSGRRSAVAISSWDFQRTFSDLWGHIPRFRRSLIRQNYVRVSDAQSSKDQLEVDLEKLQNRGWHGHNVTSYHQ